MIRCICCCSSESVSKTDVNFFVRLPICPTSTLCHIPLQNPSQTLTPS